MGVRITADDRKVALFDSVTGLAFGPVFDDKFEAQSFLDWLEHKGYHDPRDMDGGTLNAEYGLWVAAEGER